MESLKALLIGDGASKGGANVFDQDVCIPELSDSAGYRAGVVLKLVEGRRIQ